MDESLRVVVVDDEALAREGIALALRDGGVAGVELVASCGSAAEAVPAIVALRPDVLLLDVQMPEADGFALLEMLEPHQVPPAVVFVTAHDAHALRAFEASALDFVLKPVLPERLGAALARARRRVAEARAFARSAEEPEAAPADERPGYLTQFVSRARDGVTVVPVAEVEWIQADAYTVWLHTAERAVLLRERMHVLERRLDPAHFVRTHRSAIVRVDQVRAVERAPRFEHAVVLRSGRRVPLGRARLARLEAALAGRPP